MLLFALTRAALLLLAFALGLFGGLLLPALAFLARLAAAPLFLGLALLGLTLARLALGGFHLAPAAFLARFLLALLFLRAPLSRFLVALPAAAALGLLGGAALLGLVTPALLRRHAARIGLGIPFGLSAGDCADAGVDPMSARSVSFAGSAMIDTANTLAAIAIREVRMFMCLPFLGKESVDVTHGLQLWT